LGGDGLGSIVNWTKTTWAKRCPRKGHDHLIKECDFFLSLAMAKEAKIPHELKAAAEAARKKFLEKARKRKAGQGKSGHSGKRAWSSISEEGEESDVYMAAVNKENDSLYDFCDFFEEEDYSSKRAIEIKRAKIAKQHMEN